MVFSPVYTVESLGRFLEAVEAEPYLYGILVFAGVEFRLRGLGERAS